MFPPEEQPSCPPESATFFPTQTPVL